MVLTDNDQDLEGVIQRSLISESFPEHEYSQFREFCASSNIFYVDELRPYDYVAFRTQSKTDVEFVRKIRTRAEGILSDKAITTSSFSDSKPVTRELESESPTLVGDQDNIAWE